jgi:teichuronic acid biosynthesis protein TuaE
MAGATIFILVSVLRSKTHIQLIIYTLLVIVAILLAIGVWELITGLHLPVSRLSTDDYSGNYASTVYLNRNNFSFFLSSMSPILFYSLIANDNNKHIDIVLSIFVSTGLVISVINGSRAATLSYLLAIGTVLFGCYLRKIKTQNLRWPHIGLSVYFVSTASYILLPLTLSNPFSQDVQGSLSTRWELMRGGAENIRSSPLEPAGLGMFETAIPITSSELPATPHNWATQLGVETGLIGLLLFVIGVGLLIDQLFSLYYANLSDWALPVATSLLIFPLNGLGPSDVLSQASIFWVIIGLGIVICIVSVEEVKNESKPAQDEN